MLGGNYSRFLGVDWGLEETLEQMRTLEPRWSDILNPPKRGSAPKPPKRPHHRCC